MAMGVFSHEAREKALRLLRARGVTSISKVLRGFDEEAMRAAERLGLGSALGSASYVQVNEEIVKTLMERRLRSLGVVVLPLRDALEKYSWAREYYWRALPVDSDVYTALVEVYGEGKGYFVYVPPGTRVHQPIYVCLLVTASGETQLLHNIVVLGKGAEATIITGCGASHGAGRVAHIGATEIYLGEDASLNYVMIHSWTRGSEVRPRTSIVLEKGARYTEYYLSYGGVGVLESRVWARLGSSARLYSASVIVAEEGSSYTIGSKAVLLGEESSAELVSRIIGREGSKAVNKAIIEAHAPRARGHIECQALPLGRRTVIETVPVLRSYAEGAELSHEAAIGRLNEEELAYLMARGLDEDQARAILLRGFIHVDVPGLPESIKRLVESVEKTLAEKHAL